MTRMKGEVPSGFSAEPLDGPAYERAVERGHVAGVRRADAIARRKEAAAKAAKAAKEDEAPVVRISMQIPKGPGRIVTETSFVPAPQTRRPRPQRLIHAPILDGSEVPGEVGLQPDMSRGVWVDEVPLDDETPSFDPYCTDASISAGGIAAVLGQPFATSDEIELTEGYVDAREQVQ